MKLKIDLKEMFGDKINDPSLREEIGQAIIDKIVNNTQKDREDRTGSKLSPKYSEEYSESLAFQAFDKSRNKVNMTLTGEMLNSLDITKSTPTELVIGFDEPQQSRKAHGHITGAKGRLPVRDFFGLPDNEWESIKRKFKSDVKEERPLSEASLLLSQLLNQQVEQREELIFELLSNQGPGQT